MKRKMMSRRKPRRFLKRRRVFKRKGVRRWKRDCTFVKRKVRLQTWLFSAATTDGFWRYYTIAVNSLPGISDYLNTFEEYKICALKYEFIPQYTQVTYNDTGSVTQPAYTLWLAADPRTSTINPTGTYSTGTFNNFLQECNTARTFKQGRTGTVFYRPTIAESLAGTTTDKFIKAPWLRSTNSAALHFGHHAFIQAHNFAAPDLDIEVYVTMYVKFRGAK